MHSPHRNEVVKRYQQGPKFKEYKRKYYLNKKRNEIMDIAIRVKGQNGSRNFRKEIENMNDIREIRQKTREYFGDNYKLYF